MRILRKAFVKTGLLIGAGFLFLWFCHPTYAQSGNVKALVGGMLIDGFGSKPVRNSVIVIDGERIKA
ncbi:MAG: hypothetical protein ACRENG_38965, partial [bacterium]